MALPPAACMASRGTRTSVGSTFAIRASLSTSSMCVSGLESPMLNASPSARGSVMACTIASTRSRTGTNCIRRWPPPGAQAVPEELLPVERIAGPVDERRPEGHYREARLGVHTEQHALRGGLVPDVGIGVIIGRQRVAFLVVESVAVGGHAGHEDVPAHPVAEQAHGSFHLGRGGAVFPIVRVVEHHLEPPPPQGFPHGIRVIAIRHDVLHPPAEIVLRLAVQDRNFVPSLDQLIHEQAANKESPANDQYLHTLLIKINATAHGVSKQNVISNCASAL